MSPGLLNRYRFAWPGALVACGQARVRVKMRDGRNIKVRVDTVGLSYPRPGSIVLA